MKKVLTGILIGVGLLLSGYSLSKNTNHAQPIYPPIKIGLTEVYSVKLQDNSYCVIYVRNGIQCDFSERIK